MSDCTDIQSRLNLYLDDELQGDERRDFEHHLQECQSCRLVAQAEKRFLDGIRAAEPLYVASPELTDRVRTVLNLSIKDSVDVWRRRRSSKRTRVVATIAAAAVLL